MRGAFRVQFVAGVAVVISVIAVFAGLRTASAQSPPELERVAFLIATGPVGGSYLQAGEALAITISHPPGLGRCSGEAVCGPRGLIATTRSSSGSIANALAVERETVQSALIQGDVLAAAMQGSGPFAETGPLRNIRVLARLHDEALHVVVGARSGIKRLSGLRGRRIAIDTSNAATIFTAKALLASAGVKLSSVSFRQMPAEQAAEALRSGKIDGLVVMGVAPVAAVEPLVRRREARLLSVDARTLQRLTRKNPLYSRINLPTEPYRLARGVTTLGVASVWVVHERLDPGLAEKILRAFWAPGNQTEIARRLAFASGFDSRKAMAVGRLPVHAGARRFHAMTPAPGEAE